MDTSNTDALIIQFSGDSRLIVTTIQKLNTAVTKARHLRHMDPLREKRLVFIFDECHRSQFGKTHETIKKFFFNCQMFGFTGTPIFKENAGSNEYGKRTTDMLFGDELHRYVITDAIRDENVLKFSIEYIFTFKKKDEITDINVEDIDREEVMNAPSRLNHITDYIIAHHGRNTHNREFTAIIAVSSVKVLIDYYRLIREKREKGEHNLKTASIFSYAANEDDRDAMGGAFVNDEFLEEAADAGPDYSSSREEVFVTQHSRDALEEFIGHYNNDFGTNFTTRDSKSFYNYYNDISKKVKNKQIDILLVVNMFLTGFDSKSLNTLYVDKNLRYHGLI